MTLDLFDGMIHRFPLLAEEPEMKQGDVEYGVVVDAEAAFRKTTEVALAAFCTRNEEFFTWHMYLSPAES